MSEDTPTTRELVRGIADDMRTITRDELALLKDELRTSAKKTAVDSALIAFGAAVALIGLAMLCAAVVAALRPLIASHALRLLLMGVVYAAIGGAMAAFTARRLRRDVRPDVKVPAREARSVAEGVKATLSEQGRQVHA